MINDGRYPDYPLFKGLQRPLELMGLQGRYIYWAAGVAGGAIVGFIAAWNQPGNLPPITAGIAGGLLTTFTTFLPSFMFIFAGAPYIEAITSNKKLNAALTGISGAVVGVVAGVGAGGLLSLSTLTSTGAGTSVVATPGAAMLLTETVTLWSTMSAAKVTNCTLSVNWTSAWRPVALAPTTVQPVPATEPLTARLSSVTVMVT